jgi:hypothetical protein
VTLQESLAVVGAVALTLVLGNCVVREAETPKVAGQTRTMPFEAASYTGPREETLLLDSRFTPFEEARIVYGLQAWENAVGSDNLHLTYKRTDDAEQTWGGHHELILIRRGTSKEIEADCGFGKIGCFGFLERHIFLAVEDLPGDKLVRAAGHELGHALGLHHPCEPQYPDGNECVTTGLPPSVMGYRVDLMALDPQAWDVVEFCRLNGCRSWYTVSDAGHPSND